MRRVDTLDGMRGYFLVFMLLNHMTFFGGYWLVKVNHAELGFVQDAQGFVFLSGLLVGMVHARRMDRQGFAAGARKIWTRAGELYVYAIACIALILGVAAVEPLLAAYWQPWLGDLRPTDPQMIGVAATLTYQPIFMDILPQYIVYLLAAPPLVWLVVKGRWASVAIGSAVLWLGVQLGAHIPLADAINGALGHVDEQARLRSAFNVLAWQAVFMSGLVLGALSALGRIRWGDVFRPDRTGLVKLSAALLVFFLAWRLGFTFGLVPDDVIKRFQAFEVRPEFGLVFALNFAALAYAVAWMMIAGPSSDNARIRRVAGWLEALFSLRFLRLLGRHSLQVYAFHVPLAYAVYAIDQHYGPFSEPAKAALALTGVALLALPALAREADWRAIFRRARTEPEPRGVAPAPGE